MEYQQKTFRVNANGPTDVATANCYLDWIKTAIVNGGTGWVITLRDKADPDVTKRNVFAVGTYQNNQQDIANFFQCPSPVLFKKGMEIIAAGTTAGDIW